jgi:hypothetical protein
MNRDQEDRWRIATRRIQVEQNYEEWLSTYDWKWFATLKMTKGRPSRQACISAFEAWINEVQTSEGSSRFRWARVVEKGSCGDNLHVHVLVGGFRNRIAHWSRRWEELGGDALIQRFDPDRGAIKYILKTIDRDGDLDIDFHLPQSQTVTKRRF